MSSVGKIPSSLLHWALQQGQHGISACVSAFARQYGEEVRTQHGAASLEHERNHAGPPSLRHEASPASSSSRHARRCLSRESPPAARSPDEPLRLARKVRAEKLPLHPI